MSANTLGITVNLSANTSQFGSQINQATGHLNNFQHHAETMSNRASRALGALGVGLSVAAIGAFVKSGIDAADALNDMSLKTGIAVERLSGFQLATQQSGTDMAAFTAAANKLSVNIGKNSEEFTKLGITAKDPADAFIQLADVMAGIDDPQQRAALGAKALGKSWVEMAPLLLQGGAALQASVEQGAALNGITTKMAHNADEFNDRLEIMTRYLGNIAATVTGPLVNGFNIVAGKISDATDKGLTFNNVMRGLGDVVFDRTSLTGFAGDLQRVTDQIEGQQKKIQAIKDNGVIGGAIDLFAGTNINVEINKLDALYREQADYFKKSNALFEPGKKELIKPSNEKIAAFISGDGDGEKAAKKVKDNLSGEATSIFEKTRTPLEKYNEELAKLNGLLAAGAISQDTFTRASIQAGEALAGNAAKSIELTNAQKFRLDQLNKSLKIFQNQAVLDAQNNFTPVNNINGQSASERVQSILSEIGGVHGIAPSTGLPNLQPGDINQPVPVKSSAIKINANEIMKDLASINKQMSDYLEANPLTQTVNIITKNSGNALDIDFAALSGGTR